MPPHNPPPSTDRVDLRLPLAVVADLDALAASCGPGVTGPNGGGGRKQAACEAIAQFRRAVHAAGERNAEELSADDWTALGHLQDVSEGAELFGAEYGIDWAGRIAQELADQFEGRAVISGDPRPKHAVRLAKKIAGWSTVRGYALMSALRYFWRHAEAGIIAAQSPDIWLTPMAKE